MPRMFPHLVTLFLALTPMARAQDIPASSPAGIDYLKLTEGDAQLAAILLAGEAEWMSAVQHDEDGEQLAKEWEDNANDLYNEKVIGFLLTELEQYAPNLLRAFKDLPEEKYPLLYQFGRGQVIDDLGKTIDLLN